MLGTSPNFRLIDVVPVVLNSDAYDAGDTLFDTTAIPYAAPQAGAPTMLQSVTAIDLDDQAAAVMTLWFLDSNVAFGTADAAPSITDANAIFLQGSLAIPSASFLDVGGSKVAYVGNLGLILKPAAGTQTVYFAATTAGTPTQTTAAGLRFRFGFRDI